MICAHPDDETLFGAQELILEEYLVICVTSINRFGKETKNLNDFKKNMEELNTQYIIWDFIDKGFTHEVLTSEIKFPSDKGLDIRDNIREILLKENFIKIVTHGCNGEYGHPQHIGLSQVVFDICLEFDILDKLYHFDLTKIGKVLRKNKQITHQLGDVKYKEIINDNNDNNDLIIDFHIVERKKHLCENYSHANQLLLVMFKEFVLYSCIVKCSEIWSTEYNDYQSI